MYSLHHTSCYEIYKIEIFKETKTLYNTQNVYCKMYSYSNEMKRTLYIIRNPDYTPQDKMPQNGNIKMVLKELLWLW